MHCHYKQSFKCKVLPNRPIIVLSFTTSFHMAKIPFLLLFCILLLSFFLKVSHNVKFLHFPPVLGLLTPGSEGGGGVLQCWLLRLVIAGTWSEALLLLCSWWWSKVKGESRYTLVTAAGKDERSALFRLGGCSYWISLLGLLQNRLTIAHKSGVLKEPSARVEFILS